MRAAVYNLCTVTILLITALTFAADTGPYLGSKSDSKCNEDASRLTTDYDPKPPSPTAFQISHSTEKSGLFDYLASRPATKPALIEFFKECTDIEKLGEGGMGKVYRIKRFSGQEYVIKIPKDPGRIDRYRNEAQVAAKLRKSVPEGIPSIEFNEDLGVIKMEFVKGTTLHRFISSDRYQSLTAEKKTEIQKNIIQQVARILDGVHKENVIHRDIKPENVMLTGDLNDPSSLKVTLIDFGIARDMSGPDLFENAVGTYDFMSYDALSKRNSPSNDHFALYITLHHLLGTQSSHQQYSYNAFVNENRFIPVPWGTWAKESIPELARNNVRFRAMMLLLRYPPKDKTAFTLLPSISEMMDSALGVNSKMNEEEFWEKFNLQVRARDTKNQALIFLADDELMEKGKAWDKRFMRGMKERMLFLAADPNAEWNPREKIVKPNGPVIHDVTLSNRNLLAPLIEKQKDNKMIFAPEPILKPLIETKEEKDAREAYVRDVVRTATGIGVGLAIGGGYLWWRYFSP